MDTAKESHWQQYFECVFKDLGPSLNYPNIQCQTQTWTLALEAAGPFAGRRCLDVGCGHGNFSMVLSAMGGHVVGVDFVDDAARSKRFPHITWATQNLADESFGKDLGTFDRIFVLEVLQYTDLVRGLQSLWKMLAPGGRIVGTVPNRNCPIVVRTMERFEGKYVAPTPKALISAISSLEGLDYWGGRGVAFQTDQRIVPYVASSWSTELLWLEPPNRMLFTAAKKP
jgi:2-polyprenyl-3-methyl-5-hydroxy-6-metoxy-1,4-benzoquinol methylase